MKKASKIILSSLMIFAFVFGTLFMPILGTELVASASEKSFQIIETTIGNTEESLTSFGITQDEVSKDTPFNANTFTKLAGNSYKPTLIGDTNQKYINSTIKINGFSELDASGVDPSKLSLEFYVDFDKKPNLINRGLSIEFSDETGANILLWDLSLEDIKALTTRTTLSTFDKKIFGTAVTNTPVGWVKVSLPIATATVTGEVITGGKFNYTKLKLSQMSGLIDQSLKFYDMKLVENVVTKTENTSDILDYANVYTKPNLTVVPTDTKYYINEYFPKFMTTSEFFVACRVGNVDYLDGNHSENLVIQTDNGLGTTKTFAYGSNSFVIESPNYRIDYGFKHDGKFVSVLNGSFSASDYGKGVWLETIDEDMVIGEVRKVKYTVHEAFSGASIGFASSNSDVLKIKEVNQINKYIIVEAVSNGNAQVVITINDDRLNNNSKYEETGLENSELEIKVVKPKAKTNTTVVMLWVAFGLLSAGLVYVAIKAIIDARRIEIK